MKKFIQVIATVAMFALPFFGHAQTVVYSDSFESDSVGANPPVGWQDIGTGSGNGAYADVQTGSTYAGTYTNLNGAHATYLYLDGLNGTTATYQGNDFSNSNVGQTFAANTTYTLTYLYGENGGGATNVSLTANGTVIGSSTKIITEGSTAFASGPTVTVDTAANPGLVGQNIGIDVNWTPYTGAYFHNIGIDNIQITSMPDTATGIAHIGVNLEGDWLWTDVIHMAAREQWNTSTDLWGSTAATVDSNGWPTQDCSLVLWTTPGNDGTYTIAFNGKAKLTDFSNYGVITPQNADGTSGTYNASTNTTTATMVVAATTAENFALIFTNTQRTSSSGTNTGITNIHVYRPTYEGSATSYPVGSVFTTQTIAMSQKFAVTRFMDQFAVNQSTVTNWSDRNPPGFWLQGAATHPLAYENAVAYCNATNTDMYVNIPLYATDAYVTNLAKLIKYGSDGINPYTSVQASPVYLPLKSSLHVYLEYSNEVWNSGFLAQSQNYNLVVADQSANNAEWTVLNFDGGAASNLWYGAWRRIALRALEISNDFRAVYGNAAMPPNVNATVRPLIEFQAQDGQATGSTQLHFIDAYYNNGDGVSHVTTPEPVAYYFWGGGGATYYTSNNDSASTVDAIFAAGIPNTNYGAMIQTDAAVVKSYGIKRVAYEGGWQLYDGTNGYENIAGSAAALAKYDPRATTVFKNANTSFQQSGGDLNIFYTSSSFDANYVWGMTDSIFDLTVPLYAGVSSIGVSTPSTPTYGNAIAGTGTTTLAYGSQLLNISEYGPGIGDNGTYGWLPLISTAGNYQVSINVNSTTADKYVKVMVDGQVVGGGPISVPVSSTPQTVIVATVNLPVGQHGLIVEGQYTSNNNYSGSSGTFTSVVLTKVP